MEEKKKPAKQYQRKPLVVKAIQWTGRNLETIQELLNTLKEQAYMYNDELFVSHGLGETSRVFPGDWIILKPNLMVLVLEPHVFHEDYVLGKEL